MKKHKEGRFRQWVRPSFLCLFFSVFLRDVLGYKHILENVGCLFVRFCQVMQIFIRCFNVIVSETLLYLTSIDKLGIDEYNVGEISEYAKNCMEHSEYDEVYAEYRVKELLR